MGRDDLLEAAERLIRSDGATVTLEAIAAAAGVTKPILYREVGDKAAVVDALAERLVHRINAAVGRALVGATDRADGWRRFVDAYLSVVDAERDLFLFTTTGGAGAEPRLLRMADLSAGPLAAVDGSGPADLTRAYAVIGMLHVVTLWWLRDRAVTREQLVEHLVGLLASGLAIGAAPGYTTDRPSSHPSSPGVPS